MCAIFKHEKIHFKIQGVQLLITPQMSAVGLNFCFLV